MSRENVELHRRNIEVWHARDFEAFIATCDPSIEFTTEFSAVGGGYHGHDGLRKFLRDFEDAWGDEIRLEPEAYFDLGEHTLAFHVLHGRGRESGAQVAMPVAHVFRWRDGLAIYFKAYDRRGDALKDLGVSEDSLERIDP